MKKYAMIQMEAGLHSELKKFCKEHGHTISGLVERLVKEKLKSHPANRKVLPVKTSTG